MDTIAEGPGRVLLVGDDSGRIPSCRDVLAAKGLEVQVAAGHSQALSMANEWAPDLVLIIYVSENDGCDAHEKVASSPLFDGVPVFLGTVSGLSGRGDATGSADLVFLQTAEGLARDVAGRKRKEQEKALLKAQLRRAQRMEAIGTLAGGIAHDFNNILTPIMLHTEICLAEIPKVSPLQTNLQEILKAGKRARDLVKQILAFSRSQEEKRISLQLSVLVKETLKLLRASLPATIEIIQRIDDDTDYLIFADPVQMNQVLLNLCTNGSHAMREHGGILEVRLEVVRTPGKIDNLPEMGPEMGPGPFLRLVVSDTGHGIEKELQHRIFEPFFTTRDRGDGAGLGLAVVHGIVLSHDGLITVESAPGEGAVFQVLFPVMAPEEKSKAGKSTTPRGSERILFVDDEKPMRNSLRSLLGRLGYSVETRKNGHEALELFLKDPQGFDLVLTDQTMPGMTGTELARALLQVRPDLPVILCTGFSEGVTDEDVRAMGIRRLVLKPFGMHEIGAIIRDVFESKI